MCVPRSVLVEQVVAGSVMVQIGVGLATCEEPSTMSMVPVGVAMAGATSLMVIVNVLICPYEVVAGVAARLRLTEALLTVNGLISPGVPASNWRRRCKRP